MVGLTYELFSDFVTTIARHMSNKPLVEEIKEGPVLYVGDLHGYYNNFTRVFRIADKKHVKTIVFLGDYVDRGPRQLDTLIHVAYIYAKMNGLARVFDFIETSLGEERAIEMFKYNIIALRGNHEDPFMNESYGFMENLLDIFYTLREENYESNGFGSFRAPSIKLGNVLMGLYAIFPVCAVTRWKTFITHGGIYYSDIIGGGKYSTDDLFVFLKKGRTPFYYSIDYSHTYETSELPPLNPEESGNFVGQLLWNDVVEESDIEAGRYIMGDAGNGFYYSMRGNGVYAFDRRAFDNFMKDLGFKRLIRAHNADWGAYRNIWNNRLVHIFSAYPYGGKIRRLVYFLEFSDGSGEVLDANGDIIEFIKEPDW